MSPPTASVEATDDTHGIIIPDPLTLEGVGPRRTQAGKLIAGVAAPADVSLFKGRDSHSHKPLAKTWDHRFNAESSHREPSSIKGAAKYLSKPGIISLGGGLPSSEYFPFHEVSLTVPTIGAFSEEETAESGVTLTAGKYDLSEDKSIFDISTAFNYGQGSGSAQLLRFIVEHTEIVHNPPYADWSCTMTIGSTSGLDMALRMFAHPKMFMLTEEYTFSTAVEAAAAMGVRVVNVEMDTEGMLATSLDSILSNWDETARGGPKPFFVYTVPSGQNPTGATQSFQRRKDIYAVAQKHDLLILEDEPYYFLQMQPYTGQNAPDVPPPASHAEFLKSLVPSLLSIDTDGRILRIDSFSKVLAPGSRLGWITAPEAVVQKYKMHSDVSTQGPSGFTQLMLFKLLDEHWGHAGYLDWLIHIRLEYTKRRDVILSGCEDFLPTEIVSWKPPMAGMFHWMEIDWRKHPLAGTMDLVELEARIWHATIDEGCLLIRGSWFFGDKSVKQDKMFFRATFGAARADKIREAVKRFGSALRKEFGLVENEDGATNGHA